MRKTRIPTLEIVLFLVAVLYFFHKKYWRWYTENPSLLLVAGAIGVFGGLGGFLYYRLSKSVQNWVRILFFASFAVAFTTLFVMLFGLVASHFERTVLRDFSFQSAIALIALIAMLFWWQCWLEVKKTFWVQGKAGKLIQRMSKRN
jgi:hypothetical protein